MTKGPTELLATCWTSAGNVKPLMSSEVSPLRIEDRIQAVSEAGWAGIGIVQDDLRLIRDQLGFDRLRKMITDAGLRYVEVEILTDWWEAGNKRSTSDDVRSLLFDAAAQLEAVHIKIGTAFGDALASIDPLISPLRDLADDAAEYGLRIALEPMPFSMVANVPMAADLVRAVDRNNCGVLLDSWHVFRANTPVADVRASLSPDILFGVELNDAADTVVGTLFEDTTDRRLLCGQGSFDLIGLVQTVAEVGWQGPWGVEIISDAHRALDLTTALERSHRAATTIIEEALR